MWLDGVAQRRIAISAFVLVQILKLSLMIPAILSLQWINRLFSGLISSTDYFIPLSILTSSSSSWDLGSVLLIWCFLDSLYFLCLRIARIPWMTLSAVGTIVMIIASCSINAGIIAGVSSLNRQSLQPKKSLEGGWMSPSFPSEQRDDRSFNNIQSPIPSIKPASGGRKDIPIQNLVESSDYYLSGSHTIRVKPPTIAKWNPNGTLFCNLPNQNLHLVPMLIKGIGPFLIDVDAHFPNGTTQILSDIPIGPEQRVNRMETKAGRPTFAFLKESLPLTELHAKTLLYAWSVHDVGVYTLRAIRDQNGDPGKVLDTSQPVIVSPCPAAEWIILDSTDHQQDGSEQNYCVDDVVKTRIRVAGIPPFTVFYSTKIGHSSPIASSVANHSLSGSSTLFEDLSRKIIMNDNGAHLNPTTTEIPVQITIHAPNLYELNLLRVIDGLNNTIDLTHRHELLKLLPASQDIISPHLILAEAKSSTFKIQGRAHPTASFLESSINPYKLRTFFEAAQGQSKPTLSLGIRFNGVPPFKIHVAYSSEPTGNIDRAQETNQQHENLSTLTIQDSNMGSIQVEKAGSYRLVSVSDRFCSGTVELPLISIVEPVEPPTFSISSSPIEEVCVGAIGAKVNLSFSGYPPYWAEYVVEVYEVGQNNRMVSRYVERTQSLDKPRHVLKFEPHEPGSYRYIFTKVGDANYPDGVPIRDALSVSQVIHPHSNARFIFSRGQENKFTKCIDDSVRLQVQASGVGPWKVTYDVRHGTTRTRMTLDIPLEEPTQNIVLGGSSNQAAYPLNTSGTFVVDLVDITDGNGCSRSLDSSDAIIEILPRRPTAAFYMAAIPSLADESYSSLHKDKAVVKMLDGGSISLPVSFTGRGPFELEYQIHLMDSKKSEKIVMTNLKQREAIHIRRPGTIELLSVKDKICDGIVEPSERIRVELIEKPSVQISTNLQKETCCLGESDAVRLDFLGKGPFKVQYQYDWSAPDYIGIVSSKTIEPSLSEIRQRDIVGNTFDVSFNASKSGLHRIQILAIADDNYRSWTHVDLEPIKQYVMTPPEAAFMDPTERVFQCLDQDTDELTFPVRLEGVSPFHLRVGLQYESQKIQYLDFQLNEQDLKNLQSRQSENNVSLVTGTFDFRPGSLNDTGRYVFFLDHLRGGNGCSRSFGEEISMESSSGALNEKQNKERGDYRSPRTTSPWSTSVTLVSQAKITSRSPPSVCVGDTIYFGLEGTPPFTVTYTWNGQEQAPVTVGDPMLSLWAGSPGILEIKSVCNGLACCSSPHNGEFKTIVRGIPRAVMDGGKDTVDDIREGDESELAVEFEGEPPFTFTYTRMLSQDVGPESFTVSNIEHHKWSTVTNLEGIFKVTAVQDKYCAFPRIFTSVDGANVVLR